MKYSIHILTSLFVLILTHNLSGQEPFLKYSFTGNANDESENLNHGEITNAVLTKDFNEELNSAYLFNGHNSYISAGMDEILQADTAITIMACIMATGNGSPNSGGIIVNKEGEYSLARFEDGSLRFAISDENGWYHHINTNMTIPLNEPTHVALTYSKSEKLISIFVNSEVVYTEVFDAIIGDNHPELNELRIGGRQFLPQYFEGVIDEVRLYDVALPRELIKCQESEDTMPANKTHTLNIYPVPSINHIYIDNENNLPLKYDLFDITGRAIKRNAIVINDRIDISALNAGAYIVIIISEHTTFLTRSIIKL